MREGFPTRDRTFEVLNVMMLLGLFLAKRGAKIGSTSRFGLTLTIGIRWAPGPWVNIDAILDLFVALTVAALARCEEQSH